MALKPYRNPIHENISCFMFETAEPGGVVCAHTGFNSTGRGLDDANRRVVYVADPSGHNPVGVLVSTVVNIDQSRQMLNPYKPLETQIGGKVLIYTKGEVLTNMIGPAQASGINFPANAYVGTSGLLYTAAGYAASGWPVVGKFLTGTDSDGYAILDVRL